MAKLRLGAIAGEISGSVGTWTFAHNRGGAYVRLRSIPDKFTTPYAMAAKSRLALCSANWRQLTSAQQLAWVAWASANPVTDTLGEKRPLTGQQAYVSLAARQHLAGVALPTTPPADPAPDGLITCVLDADIGAGDFDLTYTATPLAAGLMLWIQVCNVPSASVRFVKNRLRFLQVSAAAQASPFAIQTAYEARWGLPAVGSDVVCWVSVLDSTTGLLSMPIETRKTVTST